MRDLTLSFVFHMSSVCVLLPSVPMFMEFFCALYFIVGLTVGRETKSLALNLFKCFFSFV